MVRLVGVDDRGAGVGRRAVGGGADERGGPEEEVAPVDVVAGRAGNQVVGLRLEDHEPPGTRRRPPTCEKPLLSVSSLATLTRTREVLPTSSKVPSASVSRSRTNTSRVSLPSPATSRSSLLSKAMYRPSRRFRPTASQSAGRAVGPAGHAAHGAGLSVERELGGPVLAGVGRAGPVEHHVAPVVGQLRMVGVARRRAEPAGHPAHVEDGRRAQLLIVHGDVIDEPECHVAPAPADGRVEGAGVAKATNRASAGGIVARATQFYDVSRGDVHPLLPGRRSARRQRDRRRQHHQPAMRHNHLPSLPNTAGGPTPAARPVLRGDSSAEAERVAGGIEHDPQPSRVVIRRLVWRAPAARFHHEGHGLIEGVHLDLEVHHLRWRTFGFGPDRRRVPPFRLEGDGRSAVRIPPSGSRANPRAPRLVHRGRSRSIRTPRRRTAPSAQHPDNRGTGPTSAGSPASARARSTDTLTDQPGITRRMRPGSASVARYRCPSKGCITATRQTTLIGDAHPLGVPPRDRCCRGPGRGSADPSAPPSA